MKLAVLVVLAIVPTYAVAQPKPSQHPVPVPPISKSHKLAKQDISLSPEAFSYLIVNNELSSSVCHRWITAASNLSEDSFHSLDEWLYSETAERLRNCVQDFTSLSLADVRKASVAIFRFSDEALSAVILRKAKQLTEQKEELAAAKKGMEEAASKYNGLNILYDQLHSDYAHLYETSGKLTNSYNDLQRQCVVDQYKAYINGAQAEAQQQRALAPPPPPPLTQCRTEVVGWSLVTKCN